MTTSPTAPAAAATPSFVRSALRVYDLSLGQMLWSRRTVFMALVVGGPVVVALILRVLVTMDLVTARSLADGRVVTVTGPVIFGLMIWGFYLRFSVPLLGVFYGTALIADEVEDKTITYLFTRPISRGAVLVGKYLAYLGCTGLVVLPSVMLVFFLVVPLLGGSIGMAFPDLVKDLALLAVGLAVYGALFALVGAWLKRPLLLPVCISILGALHNLAVLVHQCGDTADAPLLHLLGHGRGKGIQPRLGESVRGLLGVQTARETRRQQHGAAQQLTHA